MEIKVHCACILAFMFIPTYSKGQSMLNLLEGENATLTFPYPCDSTEVTLQHGDKSPFYRSTTSASPNQTDRYTFENDNESGDSCSLHLTISPVDRRDAGTYICQVYKDGEQLPEYPWIGLDVDYPPGKASCKISEDYMLEGWGALSCTASVGSLQGQIGCFQGGIVSPRVVEPTRSDVMLQHDFWVRYTDPAFCCSYISGQPTDQCECKDVVWVPPKYSSTDTTLEPCPVITPGKRSLSTKSVSTLNTKTVATRETTKQNISSTDFHWSLLVIGLFFGYFFVTIIALAKNSCVGTARKKSSFKV